MSPRAAGQTGAVSVQSWCDRDSQHFPGQESNLHGSGPVSPQDNRLQEGWERIQAPFLYSAVLYKGLLEALRAPQKESRHQRYSLLALFPGRPVRDPRLPS